MYPQNIQNSNDQHRAVDYSSHFTVHKQYIMIYPTL